ncbi:MAG: MBL fold metallo-hydrolase [Acidimicrobiia bacterium]|nr:MBL fold metallo-hydrolase [Acidimicrobiia bacterium]MYC86011.1 MBL fold metallo-hydrolase [Acidimicrobiia bacterium]
MQLTVLGANGTYPTTGRPASGYLVSDGETNLWMDAGPGTYLALCNELDPMEIDAVFLSHRHADHCSDFFALYHAAVYGPGRRDRIPVVCPEGVAEALAVFLQHPAALDATFEFLTAGDGDSIRLGSMDVSMVRTNHPPPTLAPRVSVGDRSVTYTADTGPSDAVASHAAGSDLLLADATMTGTRGPGSYPHHMTGAEAGSMAARAGVRRLVLTHIPAHEDPGRILAEAEAEFDGRVALAVSGARMTV